MDAAYFAGFWLRFNASVRVSSNPFSARAPMSNRQQSTGGNGVTSARLHIRTFRTVSAASAYLRPAAIVKFILQELPRRSCPFGKNYAPPVTAGLDDASIRFAGVSAAEEQPQQNDHRYRHAQQPKQNPSSHVSLHDSLCMKNAKGNDGFQYAESETSQCPVLGIDVHGPAGGFGWPFCTRPLFL
jgi:hypothetical protein